VEAIALRPVNRGYGFKFRGIERREERRSDIYRDWEYVGRMSTDVKCALCWSLWLVLILAHWLTRSTASALSPCNPSVKKAIRMSIAVARTICQASNPIL